MHYYYFLFARCLSPFFLDTVIVSVQLKSLSLSLTHDVCTYGVQLYCTQHVSKCDVWVCVCEWYISMYTWFSTHIRCSRLLFSVGARSCNFKFSYSADQLLIYCWALKFTLKNVCVCLSLSFSLSKNAIAILFAWSQFMYVINNSTTKAATKEEEQEDKDDKSNEFRCLGAWKIIEKMYFKSHQFWSITKHKTGKALNASHVNEKRRKRKSKSKRVSERVCVCVCLMSWDVVIFCERIPFIYTHIGTLCRVCVL